MVCRQNEPTPIIKRVMWRSSQRWITSVGLSVGIPSVMMTRALVALGSAPDFILSNSSLLEKDGD